MRLTCYPTGDDAPLLRPAARDRNWMDAARKRNPYKCLPLTAANSHGWELVCGADHEIVWNGGLLKESITITSSGPDLHAPVSHFGEGVLTFYTLAILRTDPGWNLWVSGPPNTPKDGATALSGLIEADWLPFPFTMNYKLTRPNVPIRFAKGEAFCFLFPVPRGVVESAEPDIRPLEKDLELYQEYLFWQLARHESLAAPRRWDSHHRTPARYLRGRLIDGSPGCPDHQTKIRPRAFVDRRSD